MSTQSGNAETTVDERELRQIVDLTWVNVEQILEILKTMPTKIEMDKRFDEMNQRFDEVIEAINNHSHP